jgi:hypothetical protein
MEEEFIDFKKGDKIHKIIFTPINTENISDTTNIAINDGMYTTSIDTSITYIIESIDISTIGDIVYNYVTVRYTAICIPEKDMHLHQCNGFEKCKCKIDSREFFKLQTIIDGKPLLYAVLA